MSANADQAEVDKFDDLAAQWWDETGPLRTLHELNPLRVRYLAGRADLSGRRVLDVGCGGGLLSEALARDGANVVGIDMAADSIAVAASHAAGSNLAIDYRQISIEQLSSEEPASFDVVTCLEVLEHVPDPAAMIGHCASMLRPDGHLFLSTINRNAKSFLMAIVGAEYVLGLVPRGTHRYLSLLQPAEVARACRDAELTIESLTGLHFNPLTRDYTLGGNVDVNFFLHARKPASNSATSGAA